MQSNGVQLAPKILYVTSVESMSHEFLSLFIVGRMVQQELYEAIRVHGDDALEVAGPGTGQLESAGPVLDGDFGQPVVHKGGCFEGRQQRPLTPHAIPFQNLPSRGHPPALIIHVIAHGTIGTVLHDNGLFEISSTTRPVFSNGEIRHIAHVRIIVARLHYNPTEVITWHFTYPQGLYAGFPEVQILYLRL